MTAQGLPTCSRIITDLLLFNPAISSVFWLIQIFAGRKLTFYGVNKNPVAVFTKMDNKMPK
jgi:hypothetical protein